MRKRTKVLVAAGGLIGALAILIAAVLGVAVTSDWGNARVRSMIESTVRGRLATGAQFHIGRLQRDQGSTWIADSVSLFGSDGRHVVSVRRVSVDIALASLVRGDVRLGAVVIDGARFSLEEGRDRRWNTARLVALRAEAPAARGARRRVIVDRVEVRNSRIDITTPDSLPRLPPRRRTFTKLNIAAGHTTLLGTDGSGHLPFSRLSVVVNDPPVTVTTAQGGVRWWSDSLRIDVPRLRLPASRARVTGSIAWKNRSRIALDLVMDSASARDIRWVSPMIPSEGEVTATVAIRSTGKAPVRYEVTAFDLKAFASHLSGRFTVTPGRAAEVRELAVAFQPLDLALVRNIFGDTIPRKAWQGSLEGTLSARGGFLDRLVIDSVAGRYRDARVPGAISTFAASGALNLSGRHTQLMALRVRIDSLDVRTIGAVAKAADTWRGALTGAVTLDGPTSDVRFREMRLRHMDGDSPPLVVSGFGRIAADAGGHWMDATLTLDTVAIAALVPDSVTVPVRGNIGGTLVLGATADTMTIDAALTAGDATTRLSGATVLDSLRTRLEMQGTIAGLDLRHFLARKEIPAHVLSGAMHVSLDRTARHSESHVELRLDSTSRIGDSPLQSATIRLGSDSTGIHLDTADVHTSAWRIEARGRLAAKGTSATDSIIFATAIDSLGALHPLLLDSMGAPRYQALAGRVRTRQGVIQGSFEHATVRTDIGATDLTIGPMVVGWATGSAELSNLPDSARGFVRGTVANLSNGGFSVDTAQVRADITDGTRARVTARAVHGDSIDLTLAADVTWPDSTDRVYRVRVDSLEARFRDHHLILALPAHAQVSAGGVAVDSLVMLSDHDAVLVAAGRVPERAAMDATMHVRNLRLEELALIGVLPANTAGRVTASAHVTGTRDEPTITASAVLDSIRTEDTERPSIRFEGTYADKQAQVSLLALTGSRTVVEAKGAVPIDLTLREVKDRVLDAPLSLRLTSDNVALSTFEGLVPRVTGLTGTLNADLDVGGTVRQPRGTGVLTLVDGAFDIPRYGIAPRDARAVLEFSGDSVVVKNLRVSDGRSAADTLGLSGVIRLTGRRWTEWGVQLQSSARNFRLMHDPGAAMVDASWALTVDGVLRAPRVTGIVDVPSAAYTIGPQRRQRPGISADSTGQLEAAPGVPNIDGVIVNLGSDVRLKSRDANVQLTGSVELFGALTDPWLSGAITATRGTYRVTVGPIKRSFRVDSGSVILEGTTSVPAALNLYTSYLVRSPESDDVTIRAHVYGMTDRPRLDLSSDLGSASSQSEIISYLVFGQSTFGIEEQAATRNEAVATARAALLPTLGGFIEASLGTVLPFFSTFQVTSTVNKDAFTSVKTSPIDGLLNSYAITGGRQFGSDAFLSLSAGRCSAASVGATGSAQLWFGAVADYRPKRTIGASLSIDPGPAPCNRVAAEGTNYQWGIDLSYDWKFGKKKP